MPCTGVPDAILPGGLPAGSASRKAFCQMIDGQRFERSAGAMLKVEGEATRAVYFLISGWLAVSKSMQDGHRQIIDIVVPGEFLDPGSADVETSAVEIEPLARSIYAAIPREEWLRVAGAHPELRWYFDRNLAASVSRMSERMLRLGKGSAESRIAYALCELCLRSSGFGLVEGQAFHIPMTQQLLGDYTGLSAVHVCRTLRRFRRNAIVDVSDHMTIVIRDLDTLAEIAQIDPDGLRREIIPAA